jgi:hypothetical protein
MTSTEPTPLFDELIADLGPLHEPVDTDYVLLVSQAVLALAERAP